MKIKNKKGFSLLMAIMITVILSIMAAGFLQITDYSNKTMSRNARALRLYWAAESAANYNVHWWINQDDAVRIEYPSTYEVSESKSTKSVYNDEDGAIVTASKFDKAEGTVFGDKAYLHKSSLLYGNTDVENPELTIDGYRLINVRYKGPRAAKPNQAVWILDSYAWDPETGDMANIVMSNVWNYIPVANGIFPNSEVINITNYGTGFNGVKGRFNEQDIRFGPAYYVGAINLDYKTGAQKYGPTFWGLVSSASPDASVSNNFTYSASSTSNFAKGLYFNHTDQIHNEAEADEFGNLSFKTETPEGRPTGGGYQTIEPLDLGGTVYSWPDIWNNRESERIWTPDKDPRVLAGYNLKVILSHNDSTGTKATIKYYSGNWDVTKKTEPAWSDFNPPLELDVGASGYRGVAVQAGYGNVAIQGVSDVDFSLVTQQSQVAVTGDLYLNDMKEYRDYIRDEAEYDDDNYPNGNITDLSQLGWTFYPSYEKLEELHAHFKAKVDEGFVVGGHLAVISGLDKTFVKQEHPIWVVDNSELVFSTAAFICRDGELSSKGVANSKLRLWNVGPVMTLDHQSVTSDASDTAQQWKKIYLQDWRYTDPTESLPPGCGEGPSNNPGGSLTGLNPSHTWSKGMTGTKTDDWRTVVWRNLE